MVINCDWTVCISSVHLNSLFTKIYFDVVGHICCFRYQSFSIFTTSVANFVCLWTLEHLSWMSLRAGKPKTVNWKRWENAEKDLRNKWKRGGFVTMNISHASQGQVWYLICVCWAIVGGTTHIFLSLACSSDFRSVDVSLWPLLLLSTHHHWDALLTHNLRQSEGVKVNELFFLRATHHPPAL